MCERSNDTDGKLLIIYPDSMLIDKQCSSVSTQMNIGGMVAWSSMFLLNKPLEKKRRGGGACSTDNEYERFFQSGCVSADCPAGYESIDDTCKELPKIYSTPFENKNEFDKCFFRSKIYLFLSAVNNSLKFVQYIQEKHEKFETVFYDDNWLIIDIKQDVNNIEEFVRMELRYLAGFLSKNEIISNRIIYSSTQRFFSWRRREINRDIQYCHPRWSQERIFLDAELDCLASNDSGILSDPWLLLEFPTYISVVILIVTRIAALKMDDQMGGVGVHNRAACFSLIFIWLHFLKSCRTFPALGIFITLLGYAIKETVNFAGIFFLFNLPYTIAFWIVFGGKIAKDDELYSDNINVGWTKLNDILYFSWQVTISVKFDDRTAMMDRIMAQIIAGTFYALSTVLCINVYIALLTETFNKVYYNAQAYAIQDQAKSILNMEKVLSQTGRQKIDDYIQENCGPLEVKLDVQDACMGEEKLWETVLRSILNRFGEFQDIISSYFRQIQEDEAIQKYMVEKEEYDLYQGLLVRDRDLRTLQDDIYELKCTVLKLIEPICTLPPKSKFPSLQLLDIKEPIEPSCLKKKRPKKSANQTKGKPIKKVKYRKKEGKKKNAANKKGSDGGTTKTEKEQNAFNGNNANNSFNNNNNSNNRNNYNYNNNNNINNDNRFDNNIFFNNNNDNFDFNNDRNGVNLRNNIYVKRRDNNFRSPVPEYQRHSICYVPEDDPHSWCPTCGNKDSFYASAPKLYQENTLERGVEPPRSLIYLHPPSENINAEPIYASIPANQNQQKIVSTPSRQSLRDIYDNSNQNLQTFTPEENQEYCTEIYDGNNLQNLPPATNVQCLGPIYETIPVKGSLHPIMANQFKNGRKNHGNQRVNSNNTFACPSDEFFIDKPVLSESIKVPQTSTQNIPHYDKVRPKSMPYFSSKDLFSQQCHEISNEPIPGSSRNTFKEDTNDRRHASEEMSPTNDILTTIDEQGSGDSLDIVEGNSSASSLEIVSLGSKGTTHRSSYHQDEFIDFDGVTVEPTLWTYPNKESYI